MELDPAVAEVERRCPACRALVSVDAEWCGQCFASLSMPQAPGRPDVGLAPAATAVTPSRGEPKADGSPERIASAAAAWPCPICDHANPIHADICQVCGTTFASLMRRDEAPVRIEPKEALAYSLLLPGLGHYKMRRAADGVARGVLVLVMFAMALLVFLSGVRTGVLFTVFAMFMALALAGYGGTAYEAHRIARGGEPLVSARTLLWGTVLVIIVSVALLALSVVTVTRQ